VRKKDTAHFSIRAAEECVKWYGKREEEKRRRRAKRKKEKKTFLAL